MNLLWVWPSAFIMRMDMTFGSPLIKDGWLAARLHKRDIMKKLKNYAYGAYAVVLLIAFAFFVAWNPASDFPVEASTYTGPSVQALVQPPTTANTESASSAATAQTKSIAGVSGQRVHLYGVHFSCSAGTATLTIKDGVSGTAIWSYTAAASQDKLYNIPLTSSFGNGMDIVVGSCGTSNVSTLDVQASQF